jgi:anti-sigma factor RsiW
MNRHEDRMLCEESLDVLEPYVDGDLPAEEAFRLQEHLAGCPACAAELVLAEKVQRELRALPLPDCPPGVLEKVRQAGKGEVVRFPREPRRERTLGRRIAAVAAALILSVGGGALFFHVEQVQRERQQIAQAELEARYALAYIGKLSRRTGLDIRDQILQKHVVAPTTRGLTRSLGVSPAPEEPALARRR